MSILGVLALGITTFFMVYIKTTLCMRSQENSSFMKKYIKIIHSNACGCNGLSEPYKSQQGDACSLELKLGGSSLTTCRSLQNLHCADRVSNFRYNLIFTGTTPESNQQYPTLPRRYDAVRRRRASAIFHMLSESSDQYYHVCAHSWRENRVLDKDYKHVRLDSEKLFNTLLRHRCSSLACTLPGTLLPGCNWLLYPCTVDHRTYDSSQ